MDKTTRLILLSGILRLAPSDVLGPKAKAVVDAHIRAARGDWTKLNLFFDPVFYLSKYPDVGEAGADPFVHYVRFGAAEGRQPSILFHPDFVAGSLRERRDVDHITTTLGKLTQLASAGIYVDPHPMFDCAHYMQQAGDDVSDYWHPYAHYHAVGRGAGLSTSPNFDPVAYAQAHLRGDVAAALEDYVLRGQRSDFDPTPVSNKKTNVFQQYQFSAQPGSDHEAKQVQADVPDDLNVIAFYLPQYHADPVNDAAWGKGYTEWTAVAKAQPRFSGHMQPRVPADLGFYSLDGGDVMQAQAQMARRAGVSCFAIYQYYLGGQKPLSKPLDHFLSTPDIDIKFCVIWANENWTRTWDGQETDIILEQRHDDALVAEIAKDARRQFADPRCLRLNGRPVYVVYRPLDVPKPESFLHRLRDALTRATQEEICLLGALTAPLEQLCELPLDGILEFPPNETFEYLPLLKHAAFDVFDPEFSGEIRDYQALMSHCLNRPAADLPLIRTAVPCWDNEPRRRGWGTVVQGSAPAHFENWIENLTRRTAAEPFAGQRILAVNAWNEWGETAFLEPDQHYGYAYLNALARGIQRGLGGAQ